MDCKYCGAQLEDGVLICPECGKENGPEPAEETTEAVETAEEVAEAAEEMEETAEETAEEAAEAAEETAEEAAEAAEETAAKAEKTAGKVAARKSAAKKKSGKKIVLTIVGIAAAAALLVGLGFGIRKLVRGNTAKHTNELGYTSYSVPEKNATDKMMNQVVATCGDMKLTNSELAYVYWEQYFSFASAYGTYLPYVMDTSLPLDKQLVPDGSMTWQEQFLEYSMLMYHELAAIVQEADKAGYVLDEEAEASLADIENNLNMSAFSYGFTSGEQYLQNAFGPKSSIKGYLEYLRKTLIASGYMEEAAGNIEVTDEEVEAYYDENVESYLDRRIMKDDSPMVNIRHILIMPETDDNGSSTEADWKEAERQILNVFKEWEDSDKTEDTFADLAEEYSQDGSASNGGYIDNVYPGQMVEDFENWCFEDGRKVGDYGIVKSEYGYHIIYMSDITDQIYWFETAKSDYINSKFAELSEEITAKYEFTTDMDKVAIVEIPVEEA